MSCEQCYTKDERIRELEARVRYLESKEIEYVPMAVPSHPDLSPVIDWLGNRLTVRAI